MPALSGVVMQGEPVDECLERARGAIALHIQGMVANGMLVPEERVQPRLATVTLAA
jgi:predicted RNase H-like HicB family nuclease